MDKIKICFITDDNFVSATMVAVQSLIENKSPETHYEINILGVDVFDFYRKKFNEFFSENIKINFINISGDKYENINKYNHVSPSALLKFDLAEIFKDYEKILYLDGDIIVQKDLSELYNNAFDDNIALCVKDAGVELTTRYNDEINVKEYFNSGVMLLNLTKMREENICKKLLETKKNNPSWPFMDQHSFNYVFNNRVRFIDVKYNMTFPLMYRNKYSLEQINGLYNSGYSCYEEMQEDAVIIHLAGESHIRPWKVINGTMSDIWMRYYSNSPVRNVDLDRKLFISELDEIVELKNDLSSYVNHLSSHVNHLSSHVNHLSSHVNHLYKTIEDLSYEFKNYKKKTFYWKMRMTILYLFNKYKV